jgi:hypothetical protein
MGDSYLKRATDFFESYFEIPKFYYTERKRLIREEAIYDLMRKLVETDVFQDEEDVRKEALTDYDVMLPPTE